MSISTPARNALRAAVAPSFASPFRTSSPIEFQSLTTSPWKPHSFRKICLQREWIR